MSTVERDLTAFTPGEYSSSVTLGEFVKTLVRNKGVFITTFLICLALGAAASLLMPKQFTASTEVLVEGAAPNGISLSPDSVAPELTVPQATYPLATQVELLQSQRIYFEALREAAIKVPETVAEYKSYPKVFVRQKDESNIFGVSVQGGDEDMAIKIARAYPVVFATFAKEMRREAADRALAFVAVRVEEEQNAIKQSEQAFADFKNRYNVSDTNAELQVRLGMLSAAEQAYFDGSSRAAAASALADRLEAEFRGTPKERQVPNDPQNRTFIVNAEGELNTLRQRRELLIQIYLETSTQVKEIDNAIKLQEARVAQLKEDLPPTVPELNPVYEQARMQVASAKADAAAAIGRMNDLSRVRDERQAAVNQLASIAKEQRDIERSIGLHQKSLEGLTSIKDTMSLRVNEIKSPVTSLTPGVFAEQSQPNWLINMTLATILGLALAVVFSLIRDNVQDKVNSKDEAFALSGLSPLAHIPERPRSKHPLITNPQSNLAFESYRVLRSTIARYSRDNKVKSLVVTSTLRGEGKSVVAANLSVAYVLNGQRTILVDSNLRNPGVHKLFGCKDAPGLGDVLLGTATIDEALQPTSVDGLFVLSAGTIPANATEAIGSPRMREIVELLQDKADMVVFDAPQVAGLADAASLASVTDVAIMVTKIGMPTKAEFKEAVGLMETSSPALLGMVENRVSAKEAHLTKS